MGGRKYVVSLAGMFFVAMNVKENEMTNQDDNQGTI